MIETTLQALTAYFSGTPQDFQSLPLDLQGTPFQRLVWEQLQAIPWGTTISYSELARRVGRPGGAQAVGQANAANPLPIIIPCHRVIAADGTLGGYSPGLERKRWLLEHEKALVGGGSGTGIPAGSQGCWPSSQAPFPITSPHSLKADRCGKDCSLGGRRPSRN